MAREQAAAQGAPAVDEAALAEMRRLIFDAPIQELADSQGISIDDAVKLRVEKSLEAAPLPLKCRYAPSSRWENCWAMPVSTLVAW